MNDPNLSHGNSVPHKVNININMFGTLMLNLLVESRAPIKGFGEAVGDITGGGAALVWVYSRGSGKIDSKGLFGSQNLADGKGIGIGKRICQEKESNSIYCLVSEKWNWNQFHSLFGSLEMELEFMVSFIKFGIQNRKINHKFGIRNQKKNHDMNNQNPNHVSQIRNPKSELTTVNTCFTKSELTKSEHGERDMENEREKGEKETYRNENWWRRDWSAMRLVGEDKIGRRKREEGKERICGLEEHSRQLQCSMLRHQSPPQSKTSTVSAPKDTLYVSITLLPALKVASDATVVIGIASISQVMRDNIRYFNEFDRHHCKASNGPSSQM
ncbi:hypothetical protein LXL04_026164 [Taraxacum kok-saghyz]